VNTLAALFRRTEQGILVATLLPLIETIGRPLGGFHLYGSAAYVQQLTLWIAFVGGIAATSQAKHLTLSTSEFFDEGLARRLSRVMACSVAAAVVAVLAYGSAQVVLADRIEPKILAIGIPEWVSEIVMPVSLGLTAVGGAFALGLVPAPFAPMLWPLTLLVFAATLLGAPVFVAMGGIALVLFFADRTPVAAVSAEVYRLIASPTLPAIPLLTAAGYVLAESAAAERLVRFFRAIFGWMPGGIAVMVAAVCALFTTFTGGSGVTIIALGGLVYPILRKDGYSEGFSLGLVTASGSLGLLFPPSLPVILYSIVASSRDATVPADQLFMAGLLPGLLLVILTAGYGIMVGRHMEREKMPFSWREVAASAWLAKWELLLPVVIVALFASGNASMIETAAAALAYTVIVECFITRDIRIFSELPEVLLKAAALMGAVLILLSVAMGLTNYLVDAFIPDAILAWVQVHIHSQMVFLLALNALLLVLGSVLEIYSAIIILAPLIAPMGAAFGVDPVHLGVIFLANLELGFLFPPVGLNLFLSSSRFNTPLTSLYRHIVPFLIITGAGVLLITYMPWMSLGVLRLLGRH
jgi:C4-dicarboxylate transporter DctM subunit